MNFARYYLEFFFKINFLGFASTVPPFGPISSVVSSGCRSCLLSAFARAKSWQFLEKPRSQNFVLYSLSPANYKIIKVKITAVIKKRSASNMEREILNHGMLWLVHE